MIRCVTLVGARWWPVAIALLGVWLTLRNMMRVYREHCAEDYVFAAEMWGYADGWWASAREMSGEELLELRRRCVRNALACEREAAKWFLGSCGG